MTDRSKIEALRIERRDEDPAPGRRGPVVVMALVLLLAALAAGWWWSRPRAVEVRARAVVEERPLRAATVLDATGYVVARRRATVSSKVTGKIVEVRVEEGTPVKAGEILARLDDANARRELALAEAELAAARRSLTETEVLLRDAERDLERSRRLVASDVISQAELDDDQATADALRARLALGREQVRVAERRLAVRRQAVEDTIIRAPFDGIVVTKDAQPGEMISPVSAGGGFTRTGICTLVDMSSLEIEVDVNEAYIGRVRPGQRVQAVLDAYPDWRIPASVIISVPTADRQRATVKVRIAFDRLDPRLLPDMGVKVSFLDAAAPAAEAAAAPRLWIDRAAVRRDGEETYVFVAAGGRARRRAVRLGAEQGARQAVEEGLQAGELVILDPPAGLADGMAVAVASESGY